VKDTEHLNHTSLLICAAHQQMSPLAPLACHMERDDIGAQFRTLTGIDKVSVFKVFDGSANGDGVTTRLLHTELIRRPAHNLDKVRLRLTRQRDRTAWLHG
jgi:hypothetical protein